MPIGIQSFEKLRTEGYIYVDKTAYVYKLANEGNTYFLGRPRRFGKSLLLSTLKAYFLGQKELFEGLAIEKLETDWIKYPVFHIDLNVTNYGNIEDLENGLDANLRRFEKEWGEDARDISPPQRFYGLIQRACEKTGKKVVVLVDEYDKPLLAHIEEEKISTEMRDKLKGFYGVLKSADQWLQFVLLTGVTKFSKVSVFSDLNQLHDISMELKYSEICGITRKELIDTFPIELEELAVRHKISYDEAVSEMVRLYDGYHFSADSEGVLNPFSVLNTLGSSNAIFSYYWFKTGTPTFLIRLLQEANFDLLEFAEGVRAQRESIDDYRVGGNNPVPILYQSGYLTIKGYDPLFEDFILGFPNEEVKYGFLNELLPAYFPDAPDSNGVAAANFVRDLMAGDMDSFMTRLKAFFAGIPYELNDKTERHYQVVFYLIFTLMGQFVHVEEHSTKGRADAVVVLDDAVYVFEFKLLKDGNGDTAADAIKQIDDKGYMAPYTASGRKLIKVGVQFNAEERNIGEWETALDS
jgi:hypothetical protein